MPELELVISGRKLKKKRPRRLSASVGAQGVSARHLRMLRAELKGMKHPVPGKEYIYMFMIATRSNFAKSQFAARKVEDCTVAKITEIELAQLAPRI